MWDAVKTLPSSIVFIRNEEMSKANDPHLQSKKLGKEEQIGFKVEGKTLELSAAPW